jgi:hypothetical protein
MTRTATRTNPSRVPAALAARLPAGCGRAAAFGRRLSRQTSSPASEWLALSVMRTRRISPAGSSGAGRGRRAGGPTCRPSGPASGRASRRERRTSRPTIASCAARCWSAAAPAGVAGGRPAPRPAVARVRRRGARAGGILEGIGLPVAHRADQLHRRLEIRLALAGKADDEIAREQQVGAGRAQAFDQRKVLIGRVFAVHRLEDAVRARLHRQVQIGHQLRLLAMRGDQVVGHVVGVRGRVADAGEPVDARQFAGSAGRATSRHRGRRRGRR